MAVRVSIYEELLADAIDLHCHIDLEFSTSAFRKRAPEWEWLPQAEALGIRGVVLKSHWWPTAASVPYIRELYRGRVELWSSVTLNPTAGGPEVWVVEAAAAMGARVVFLPTWSARRDLARGGFSVRIAEAYRTFDPAQVAGVGLVDASGQLEPRGQALLGACAERGLTLATGHLAWEESMALAEAAHALGFGRLIFSHPLAGFIDAPLEATQRIGRLGGWVELCWTNVAPGRMAPEAAVEWIRAVGVDHVVVATDYFRAANPVPPELLRLLLGTLYDAGLRADEIRRVAAVNPARALGLPDPPGSPSASWTEQREA
jgi:hypothetical protein